MNGMKWERERDINLNPKIKFIVRLLSFGFGADWALK